MDPRIVVSGLLGLAALALYAWTAAPDIPLVDAGELALAAANGGVAHPPGVPLYTLIGRVFAQLPFATPVRALNLLSALLTAGGVVGVFWTIERLLVLRREPRAVQIGAGALGGAAFATAYNPWTWSAVTEVYSLNVFLAAGAWACAAAAVVQLAGGKNLPARKVSPKAWRWLTASTGLGCLGLANHHATALVVIPLVAVLFVAAFPGVLRSTRFWIVALLAAAGSLALYGIVLWDARHDSGLNWGGVDNLSLLWRHVVGAQYSDQVGVPAGEAARVTREFWQTLVFGSGIPVAIFALLGIVLPWRGARPRERIIVVIAPLVLIGLNLLLSVNYVAGPEDRMAYDLPATIAWCVLAGVGASFALRAQTLLRAVVLVAVVAGWNVARNLEHCQQRHDWTARTFCDDVLASVPEGGVVLTAEWNLYAPFLYRRHLENYRPDVRVIDVLMLRRFWYLGYLERTLPDLVAQSRPEFDAFRREVTNFDLGRSYDAAAIQGLYEALIRRWLQIGTESGGAFVEWSCLEHPQELGWIRPLPLVPHDLLLRVGDTTETISPKRVEHLRFVRSRITEGAMVGDLRDMRPRNDPYRKVWVTYQKSVEASLLTTFREAGDAGMQELMTNYATWYPEIERAAANVRSGVRR